MDRRTTIILYLVLLLTLPACIFAGSGRFAFPFIGEWNNTDAPITLERHDYQDIQNLRPDGKRLKGVGGHVMITTSTVVGSRVGGLYHYRKNTPFAESHLLLSASSSTMGEVYCLWDNTGVVPQTSNFTTVPVLANTLTSADTAVRASFATVPQDTLFYSDEDDMVAWGGDESNPISIYLSSTTEDWSAIANILNDHVDELTSSSTDGSSTVMWGPAGGIDSHTKMMLHMDGTDEGTTFTDSVGTHTVTANGDANTETSEYKFATASGEFDGTGDYLSVPDHADWNLGSGPGAIDFWMKFDGALTDIKRYGLVRQYVDGTNMLHSDISYNEPADIYTITCAVWSSPIEVASVYANFASGSGFNPNEWHHVAFTTDGTTLRIFVDGVLKDSDTLAGSWPDLAASLEIGRNHITGSPADFKGWIDELRWSKGSARWTSNFTPPSREYEAGAREYLLIGSPYRLSGATFYIDSANIDASTLTVKSHQSSGWQTLSVDDGTSSGGVTMAESGKVSWDEVADDTLTVVGMESLYWYEFSFDAGFCALDRITTSYDPQEVSNVWNGVEIPIASFVIYDGGTSSYIDDGYTTYLSGDDITTTVALDSFATNDFFMVGFAEPAEGIIIRVVSGKDNSTAGTAGTVQYRGVMDWVQAEGTVGQIVEDTTLARSGETHWNGPTPNEEVQYAVNEGEAADTPLYYYKVSFGDALDAEVEIYYITGIRNTTALEDFGIAVEFANRAWMFDELDGEHNIARYSAFNAPYIWNGSDSGVLRFGAGGKITAAMPLYNVFQSTGYDQLIVTKENETYRVLGSSPDTWEIFLVSPVIGCNASRSMAVVDAQAVDNNLPARHLLIWQSSSGVVKCDGAKVESISYDIRSYFDPNSANYISPEDQQDSVGWYDPTLRAYKLILGGVELEYSLVAESWTKLYREDAGGANPLVAATNVFDDNGGRYTYGVNEDINLYRLEYGSDWDGVADIDQYVWIKDMFLDDGDGGAPLFKDTLVNWVRLLFTDKSSSDSISFEHYCDGTLTVSGTSEQELPDAVALSGGPVYTTDCNLGPCRYHSFKIQLSTDTTDGLELNGLGLVYDSFDAITQ